MARLDLRSQAKSCTEHPLVALQNALKHLGLGDKIEVITNEKVVPIGVVEIIAKKYNAEVRILEKKGDEIIAEIMKK